MRGKIAMEASLNPLRMGYMVGGIALGGVLGFLAPKQWAFRWVPMGLLGIAGISYDQLLVTRYCDEWHERYLADHKRGKVS